MTEPQRPHRTRAESIRDAIMLIILVFWAGYAALSVFQIFRDGSKVLDALPPFWFWGIPLAPFTALYAPWGGAIKSILPAPPDPPAPPPEPGRGQP
jgi:hypothetical protein